MKELGVSMERNILESQDYRLVGFLQELYCFHVDDLDLGSNARFDRAAWDPHGHFSHQIGDLR